MEEVEKVLLLLPIEGERGTYIDGCLLYTGYLCVLQHWSLVRVDGMEGRSGLDKSRHCGDDEIEQLYEPTDRPESIPQAAKNEARRGSRKAGPG